MQSIAWYYNRLKMMSFAEIAWRISSLGAAALEHFRVSVGLVAKANYVIKPELFEPNFRVCKVAVGAIANGSEAEREWCQRLLEKADAIATHKLSFFDLKELDLGNPIDWNSDHYSHKKCSMAPIMRVNYRDFPINGDCKLVWEPNRHHHLVVLARAYRASGESKYAQAVIDQISSWMDANPYGYGMNWRSPLELGVRLINWVWAYDMIIESGLMTADFKRRFFECVYLHCRDVAGKFSMGTSANNHLVGEAAGVFIAASYFNLFQECEDWCRRSATILQREIVQQTYPDGCTREHALGYQFFVIQFYLFSGLTARWNQQEFPAQYWDYLRRLMTFVARLAEGGDCLPMFGDRDDGYVLDLGNAAADVNALLVWGSEIYGDPIFKSGVVQPAESAFWLFGKTAHAQLSLVDDQLNSKSLASCRFESSGYFLLQNGSINDGNQVSVLIDCAELGYTSIAAHGHADALSFAMRFLGVDLFVDTGTYDYFTFPEWRNYFRKTCAHNALEIDGLDQSSMLGPFLWGDHAQSSCVKWETSTDGGIFVGRHDGYSRLSDPVIHQRSYELSGAAKMMKIVDRIEANASHAIKLYFHLSEFAQFEGIEDNICNIRLGEHLLKLRLDARFKVSTLHGSETPKGGWLSRGYHQKVAVTTIIAAMDISKGLEIETRVEW